MATQRAPCPGSDGNRMRKQFLFVPHTGHQGRSTSSARRDMNRHVQRNSRQITPSHKHLPLPYQLRFRASDWGMPYLPAASVHAKRIVAPSPESDNSSSEGTLASPAPSPSPSPWHSQREADSVQFYQTVVSGQLGGAVTSAFWERHVLQRLQQQPVIKQALIALSLMYREIYDAGQQFPPRSITPSTPAYRANENAVRSLRSYIPNEVEPPLDVAITCAVLLFALEKTRGEREASLWHLDHAIAIFKSWPGSIGRRHLPPEYMLLRSVVILLDGNACIEDEGREQKFEMHDAAPADNAAELRFGSIEDMRDDLKMRVCYPLTRLMARRREDHAPDVLQEKSKLENELRRWRAALKYFIWDRASIQEPRGEPTWGPQEEVGILTVRAHYIVVKCFLAGVPVPNPADANTWDDHAQELLSMGERALDLLRFLHGPLRIPPDGRQRAMVITYAQSLPLFAQKTTLLGARDKAMRLYAGFEPYTRSIAICPGLRATERFREAVTGGPVFSETAALLLTLGSRS